MTQTELGGIDEVKVITKDGREHIVRLKVVGIQRTSKKPAPAPETSQDDAATQESDA